MTVWSIRVGLTYWLVNEEWVQIMREMIKRDKYAMDFQQSIRQDMNTYNILLAECFENIQNS